MKKRLFIVGYSGSIIELVFSKTVKNNSEIILMDDNEDRLSRLESTSFKPYKSLSFKEGVELISSPEFIYEAYISVASSPKARYKTKELFNGKNITFPALRQNSARASSLSKYSQGSYIGDFVTIESDVILNEFTYINNHSHVGHDSKIGKYCILGGSVTLNGRCVVEDYSFLGSSVTVINGKKIGKGSLIQAGTCVTSDVPPFSYVSGNPSKIICPVQFLGKKYTLPNHLI